MTRARKHTTKLRALGAALAVVAFMPCGVFAFEAKRGTGAMPSIDPAISISINDGKKPIPEIDYCFGPIEPNLEEVLEKSKMMLRLPVPYEKNGQAFRWQIGNEAGATYWDRKPLGEERHQITLYIAALDLMLKFPATTIRTAWSRDSALQDKGHEWLSDLSLAFLDQPKNEVLTLLYNSQRVRTEIDASKALVTAQNRNTRIEKIDRGTVATVCQISE